MGSRNEDGYDTEDVSDDHGVSDAKSETKKDIRSWPLIPPPPPLSDIEKLLQTVHATPILPSLLPSLQPIATPWRTWPSITPDWKPTPDARGNEPVTVNKPPKEHSLELVSVLTTTLPKEEHSMEPVSVFTTTLPKDSMGPVSVFTTTLPKEEPPCETKKDNLTVEDVAINNSIVPVPKRKTKKVIVVRRKKPLHQENIKYDDPFLGTTASNLKSNTRKLCMCMPVVLANKNLRHRLNLFIKQTTNDDNFNTRYETSISVLLCLQFIERYCPPVIDKTKTKLQNQQQTSILVWFQLCVIFGLLLIIYTAVAKAVA